MGDNIKMDHQEGMDLIILPQDRKKVAGCFEEGDEHSGSILCLGFLGWV